MNSLGVVNLQQMRNFYLTWPPKQIYQTVSGEFPFGNNGGENDIDLIALKSAAPVPAADRSQGGQVQLCRCGADAFVS